MTMNEWIWMNGVRRIDGIMMTEKIIKYCYKIVHFVYQKFHMEGPVIEPRNPRWEAGELLPEPWHELK